LYVLARALVIQIFEAAWHIFIELVVCIYRNIYSFIITAHALHLFNLWMLLNLLAINNILEIGTLVRINHCLFTQTCLHTVQFNRLKTIYFSTKIDFKMQIDLSVIIPSPIHSWSQFRCLTASEDDLIVSWQIYLTTIHNYWCQLLSAVVSWFQISLWKGSCAAFHRSTTLFPSGYYPHIKWDWTIAGHLWWIYRLSTAAGIGGGIIIVCTFFMSIFSILKWA